MSCSWQQRTAPLGEGPAPTVRPWRQASTVVRHCTTKLYSPRSYLGIARGPVAACAEHCWPALHAKPMPWRSAVGWACQLPEATPACE